MGELVVDPVLDILAPRCGAGGGRWLRPRCVGRTGNTVRTVNTVSEFFNQNWTDLEPNFGAGTESGRSRDASGGAGAGGKAGGHGFGC